MSCEGGARASSSSEIAIISEQSLPAALPISLPNGATNLPHIGTMNFTNSSKPHIGHKFVTVNNAIHVDEVVQGRCLGLKVTSSMRARRLRCGVAVFVCWAIVLATGLIIYFFCLAFTAKYRIDIGLNATWYLRRIDWQAMPPSSAYEMRFLKLPVRTVMIGHSATPFCHGRRECITAVRAIQKDHLERYGHIGPNFLVAGEEGFVFEGSGGNVVGTATAGINTEQISVMFLGNYAIDMPTQAQLDNVATLLDVLVHDDILHPKYALYGYYVSCWKYIWSVIKSSSRAERLACLTALVLVAICIGVVVYFTMFFSNESNDTLDIAPSIWYVKREEWLAQAYNNTEVDSRFNPLRLVVIQHTSGNQCHRFSQCATELRTLQNYFLDDKDYDIPYNFFIGNDGRAYEGRGWNKIGAHTLGYNSCSVGIGFMGDYRDVMVTDLQQTRLHMLLEEGVKLGYLHPEYKVVGAKDLGNTVSPGTNLYEVMQKWLHYDHKKLFLHKNCTQINDMPFP